MRSLSADAAPLVLAPVSRLARGATEQVSRLGPAVPRRAQEYSARFTEPWHIRTLIVPMPGGGDVELVFANLIVGRIGVENFDDEPLRAPQDAPRDEGHLALLVLGRDARVAESLPFSRAEHARAIDGGVRVEVPGSFTCEVTGKWPDYHQRVVVPGLDLEIELGARCLSPVRWWAFAPRAYQHHSGFGEASGSVVLRGVRTPIRHPVSLEPATGKNLLGAPGAPRIPATLFHYQLGTFPGAGTFALGCFRLGAFEPFRAGEVVLPDGRHERLVDWDMTVEETTWITARAGGAIEVPSRWSVRARGEHVRLDYAAVRDWPAVAGVGRLTSSGARIRGRLAAAAHGTAELDGVVYEEHLAAPGVSAR